MILFHTNTSLIFTLRIYWWSNLTPFTGENRTMLASVNISRGIFYTLTFLVLSTYSKCIESVNHWANKRGKHEKALAWYFLWSGFFVMATVGMSLTGIFCLGLHSAAGYSPRYTRGFRVITTRLNQNIFYPRNQHVISNWAVKNSTWMSANIQVKASQSNAGGKKRKRRHLGPLCNKLHLWVSALLLRGSTFEKQRAKIFIHWSKRLLNTHHPLWGSPLLSTQ